MQSELRWCVFLATHLETLLPKCRVNRPVNPPEEIPTFFGPISSAFSFLRELWLYPKLARCVGYGVVHHDR